MKLHANIVRAALVLGCATDLAIAVILLFFQALGGPLADFPVSDPALGTVAGGEFLIVAAIYVLLLRDAERFRPFFWLVALDQFFAAALVALEVAHGHIPGTWKTIGPIPLNLALVAIFVLEARAAKK